MASSFQSKCGPVPPETVSIIVPVTTVGDVYPVILIWDPSTN